MRRFFEELASVAACGMFRTARSARADSSQREEFYHLV